MHSRKSVFPKGQMFSDMSPDFDNDDQCGVNFDEDCLENGILPADFEEEGECDEDDEECLAAYIENLKKTIGISNASKGSFSAEKSDSKKNVEAPFEGLPAEYLRKKYRPDYPRALKMKQVCSPKQHGGRKYGGMSTQPKAFFIPSETHVSPIDSGISIRRKSDSKDKPTEVSGKGGPTLSSLTALEEPSPLAQNRMQIPILSGSDELVVEWLGDYNIQMMLEYFLALCVIQQPEDPWTYISELCQKMIEARVSVRAFESLPKILSPEHTEAVFRIYDRIENGFMTRAQYKSAMDTMGLVDYSMNPEGWNENAILKDTFVKESTEAIDNLLRSFMMFSGDPLPQPKSEESLIPVDEEEEDEGMKKEQAAGSSSTLHSGSTSSYSRSGTGSEYFDDNEADYGLGEGDYFDKDMDREFDNFENQGEGDEENEDEDENEENEDNDENEENEYKDENEENEDVEY